MPILSPRVGQLLGLTGLLNKLGLLTEDELYDGLERLWIDLRMECLEYEQNQKHSAAAVEILQAKFELSPRATYLLAMIGWDTKAWQACASNPGLAQMVLKYLATRQAPMENSFYRRLETLWMELRLERNQRQSKTINEILAFQRKT